MCKNDKNCFKCDYSRVDCNNISCTKDDKANWVKYPNKCEKEIDEYTKAFLNLNEEEMKTLVELMEDKQNEIKWDWL